MSDAAFGAIAAYAINGNGSLRTITEPDAAADGSVSSVAVDPSGRFVYAPDLDARKLFAFEIQGNGSLAPKGGDPFQVFLGENSLAITTVVH